MSKYTKSEEMVVCDEDKIIFENKSDSNYLVSAGIIFEKSGLYNVLVDSKRTVISKVADSQMDWIPCSERLPEEDGLYIVTTSKGQVQVHVFNHNGNSKEYWMRCNKAWMPLPEPWEGETNE